MEGEEKARNLLDRELLGVRDTNGMHFGEHRVGFGGGEGKGTMN